MMQITELIPPHKGEYYLYEGRHVIEMLKAFIEDYKSDCKDLIKNLQSNKLCIK